MATIQQWQCPVPSVDWFVVLVVLQWLHTTLAGDNWS